MKLLNGAIPAQAGMGPAVASLSSPLAMGVKRSRGWWWWWWCGGHKCTSLKVDESTKDETVLSTD